MVVILELTSLTASWLREPILDLTAVIDISLYSFTIAYLQKQSIISRDGSVEGKNDTHTNSIHRDPITGRGRRQMSEQADGDIRPLV